MADTDHGRHHVLGSSAAADTAAATTSSSRSVVDDDEGGFTFATVPRRLDAGFFPEDVGHTVVPVHYYPVFGRPRSPPLQEEEEEGNDPSSSCSATTARVPLGQLLLEDREGSLLPLDDDDEAPAAEATTYCLWSPSPGGRSPMVAATGSQQSPASRCQLKSGFVLLRWPPRLIGRRSHSDGGKDDKFVYLLNTRSEERSAAAEGSHHHGSEAKQSPCRRKDLVVGLLANAGAFRRSYHPF